MSGWRRNIMGLLANQEPHIEGYTYQTDGQYPLDVRIRYNGSYNTIPVNQDTGYFRVNVKLTTLQYCLQDDKDVKAIKIVAPNLQLNVGSFARRSVVEDIYLSGITATNLYVAFGVNASDYSSGYRCKISRLKLPLITNATTINATFSNASLLTDVEATFITQSLDMSSSPLTLQSAINILNALQDVTSYGGKTFTFSSATSAFVQADTDAMNLVAQAQANGWTIAFN